MKIKIMKNKIISIILYLALPAMLFAQYTGGIGRGDFSATVRIAPTPVLAISDTMIQYGDKVKTDSASHIILILNKSASQMTVSSISVGTNAFSVDTATVLPGGVVTNRRSDGKYLSTFNQIGGIVPEFSLPAVVKDTLKVRIWFKPNRFGTFTDTLTIVSDGGSKKVPLNGNSPYPVLSSNQTALDWLTVSKGVGQAKELRLMNGSINTLGIDSIYTKTKQFIANKTNGNVVMNETLSVSINFTADTFAVFTDTLFLHNNSVNTLVKIPLRAESPQPIFSLRPVIYRKDTVAIGDSSVQKFMIINNSINSLDYKDLTKKTSAFIIIGSTSGTVKSHDSVSFSVVFKPLAFAEYLDTLSITSINGQTKYPLSGYSPFPVMSASVASLDFGNVFKDSTAKRSIVFKNSSINKLRIDSLKTRTKQFTHTFASPVFIANKDSSVYVLSFRPDSVRTFIDTLFVYSNQQKGVISIAVTGKGNPLTSVLHGDELRPNQFALDQNYPNPFNPTTTIGFQLPANNYTTLIVYDVLGREEATLIDEMKEAGYYSATFNASKLSSGMYIARLKSGEKVQLKKMQLLK